MKDISYIVNEEGLCKGLQINLPNMSEEELEDLEDAIVSLLRRNEPTIPWEVLEAEIEAELAQKND